MYGVPADLPLDRFVGSELGQIAIGILQVQFRFEGSLSIHSEAHWELHGPTGEIVDTARNHAERDCYRIHEILGASVTRFSINAPTSFTLFFNSGHALTVFDDSDHYESFSVHLDGEPSFYI
jgi:hypothetical protein